MSRKALAYNAVPIRPIPGNCNEFNMLLCIFLDGQCRMSRSVPGLLSKKALMCRLMSSRRVLGSPQSFGCALQVQSFGPSQGIDLVTAFREKSSRVFASSEVTSGLLILELAHGVSRLANYQDPNWQSTENISGNSLH